MRLGGEKEQLRSQPKRSPSRPLNRHRRQYPPFKAEAPSAFLTCKAVRSSSENTAWLSKPNSAQARNTRIAISPRFATRIFGGPFGPAVAEADSDDRPLLVKDGCKCAAIASRRVRVAIVETRGCRLPHATNAAGRPSRWRSAHFVPVRRSNGRRRACFRNMRSMQGTKEYSSRAFYKKDKGPTVCPALFPTASSATVPTRYSVPYKQLKSKSDPKNKSKNHSSNNLRLDHLEGSGWPRPSQSQVFIPLDNRGVIRPTLASTGRSATVVERKLAIDKPVLFLVSGSVNVASV